MTAPAGVTLEQSGPSVLLSGLHRDLLLEPWHGGETWAVIDVDTSEVVEACPNLADAFHAACAAVLEG